MSKDPAVVFGVCAFISGRLTTYAEQIKAKCLNKGIAYNPQTLASTTNKDHPK